MSCSASINAIATAATTAAAATTATAAAAATNTTPFTVKCVLTWV